jgi:mannosyltransferase
VADPMIGWMTREMAKEMTRGMASATTSAGLRGAERIGGWAGGWSDLLLCGLAFAVALALRLLLPNREAVWLDEANSVLIAARSFGGIIHALQRDGNPPLYYFLLHGWIGLTGTGETSLRLFSALLGAALPPALYLMGRRFIGRTAAVTVALLSVSWPLHIYYSGQIRMYSLLPVLSVAYMSALLSALEGDASLPAGAPLRSQARRFSLVVVTGLAVIWTHNYGMFLVAATPLVWFFQGPRTRRSGSAPGLALLVIGCLDLLWLPVVVSQARTEVGAWIAREFTPAAPLRSLLLYAAGFNYPPYLQTLSGPLPTAALAVVWVVITLAAAIRLGRARVWLAFLLVALGLPYLASLLTRPMYLAGRYEIVAYPAFALLLGAGAEAAWNRGGRLRSVARFAVVGLLLIYGGLSAVTLSRYEARAPERTEEMLGQRLSQWLAPGDVVITTGLSRAPLEYYLNRFGLRTGPDGGRVDASGSRLASDPSAAVRHIRLESYPAEMTEHMGWYDLPTAAAHPDRMRREAEDLLSSLKGFRGKVFLVDHTGTLAMYTVQEPLRALLAGRSKSHRVLLRVGPDPRAGPTYEVTGYLFGP